MNVEKSFFARNELEYLDFKITREGIIYSPDKVEAIENIAVPTKKKQIQSFIRIINYYRDMWKHRSSILTLLCSMTFQQAKYNWSKVCQKAFDTIRDLVPRAKLLSYPNVIKPFSNPNGCKQTTIRSSN